MLIVDKYKPYYAPDLETGSADDGIGTPPPELDDQELEPERGVPEPADGPGSGRGKIRKQLESSFDAERKREAKGRNVSRARQEGLTGEQEVEAPDATAEEGQEQPPKPTTSPPTAWAKEAQAEWAKVPPSAQAAILKREEDVVRGVKALQAHYNDIESVLAPRQELFKQYNKSPAQAVHQLFSWFDSLGANPDQAFPALMQSFDYDPRRLIPFINHILGQQQQPAQEQGEAEVPAPVQQYIGQLQNELAQMKAAFSQEIGTLKNSWEQANQSKVQESLDMWSQGKPHFDKVRVMMGHLLESGQVPPLPNGHVDLDKAYDMALWALPDVRQTILAEAEAKKAADAEAKKTAERKAQKELADKARRAGNSLAPSAPGAPAQPNARKSGQRKSVAESLREAMAELRE